MRQTRVVTIQDISCFGKCSCTVALPLLSAMGLECAVVPTAVLSTHTGGFSDWTFRDLSNDMPQIFAHWQKNNLQFDGVYTGYLGSPAQAFLIMDFIQAFQPPFVFIDPAMADFGRLYAGLDPAIVDALRALCGHADMIVPNLTEACLLTGTFYREEMGKDRAAIRHLLLSLAQLGCKEAVITGIQPEAGIEGAAAYTASTGVYTEYCTEHLPRRCHGTGDVFASILFGARMRGLSLQTSLRIATDNTVRSIRATLSSPEQWYGVRFEDCIPALLRDIGLV